MVYQIRQPKGTANLLYTYKTFRERGKIKYKAMMMLMNSLMTQKPIDKKDKYKGASIVFYLKELWFRNTNLMKWELSKSMSRPKSNNRKFVNNTMV
jgi:hypothetical protein